MISLLLAVLIQLATLGQPTQTTKTQKASTNTIEATQMGKVGGGGWVDGQ